ncbi:hypothetical protein BDR03DRAFT_813976, partial [Suillus americanus]
IVSDTSTCRHHLAYLHAHAYHTWCEKNKFISMLPKDVKDRKTAAAITNAEQGNLDGHLHDIQPTEWVLPYSNKLFREAAIEWLASTNQPIQAVDHPSFKNMIDVASRATTGVIMPNRKTTRHEIIDMFKQQMTKLREWLSVCF